MKSIRHYLLFVFCCIEIIVEMYLLSICLSSFFLFYKMKNESRCHGVTYSRDKATLQIYLSRDKITILSLSGNYSTTAK